MFPQAVIMLKFVGLALGHPQLNSSPRPYPRSRSERSVPLGHSSKSSIILRSATYLITSIEDWPLSLSASNSALH